VGLLGWLGPRFHLRSRIPFLLLIDPQKKNLTQLLCIFCAGGGPQPSGQVSFLSSFDSCEHVAAATVDSKNPQTTRSAQNFRNGRTTLTLFLVTDGALWPCSLKKQAETLFRPIYRERKILFRLKKKQAEKYGL